MAPHHRERIHFPGANGEPIGERRFLNGKFDYDVYYIKDHLGHIRVKVRCDSVRTVLAAQDYRSVAEIPQRRDDPALGMFRQVDPHSDKYLTINPFNYGFNNPMMIIDPTGMNGCPVFNDYIEKVNDFIENFKETSKEILHSVIEISEHLSDYSTDAAVGLFFLAPVTDGASLPFAGGRC